MILAQLINVCVAFFIGFAVVLYTTPAIVRMSLAKQLYAMPNERNVNKKVIPNMGGIPLLLGIILGTILAHSRNSFTDFRFIASGMLIMFFIGLKDDMIDISAIRKLIAQVVCSLVIVLLGDIRITHLHGILGINEINYSISVLITIVAVVGTINAINLIDGIDGLAASMGILSSLLFGILFLMTDQHSYAIFCAATLGSLVVFFGYNVFGKKNKIFMGDTGALVLGLIVSVLAIHFNEYSIAGNADLMRSAPLISLAILSVPIFDTLRIFLIRMNNGESPFTPDMNHIHHKFLRLGFSHLKTTSIIFLANLFFAIIIYSLRAESGFVLLITLLFMVSVFMILPGRLYNFQQYHLDPEKSKVRFEYLRVMFRKSGSIKKKHCIGKLPEYDL